MKQIQIYLSVLIVCVFIGFCLAQGPNPISEGAPPDAAEGTLNILFFGNSFTNGSGSTDSVPNLVRAVAEAAGHPAPNAVNAAVNGKDLAFHLETNTDVIASGIPTDTQWDVVVMQDYSTGPTTSHPRGDVDRHRRDALALYRRVAEHSPGVKVVLFETWARGPGHKFYAEDEDGPIFTSGPAQMQREVRDGYEQSCAEINAAIGDGTATIAPVGDAWEIGQWRDLHHAKDRWHAQNRGTLLAAMVIYATIYDDPAPGDIDLNDVLADLELQPEAGLELAGYAERAVSRSQTPAAP